MSWFKRTPEKPEEPQGKFGLFPPEWNPIPMPIPESVEDIVRRVVREELDRRFGPTGE